MLVMRLVMRHRAIQPRAHFARLHLVVLFVWLLGAVLGCAGEATSGGLSPQAPNHGAPNPALTPGSGPVAAPPAPKARDAAAIALAITGGKVSTLIYVDRVRSHPLGPKLAGLPMYRDALSGDALAGMGLDPMKDLERVFVVAAKATDEAGAVWVGEHNQPFEKVRKALDNVVTKGKPDKQGRPAQWLDGLGVPAARVTMRGRTRVVTLPTPNLIVVLPEANAAQAAGFAKSGGLPDPNGPEAAQMLALDPSKTLRVKRAPKIPKSISKMRGSVVLTRGGGASVRLVGDSTSAEQAKKDAKTIQKRVDKATSVKVSVVRLRVFKPIVFRSVGHQVKTNVEVSASELDTLLSLASALAPR